MATSSGVFRSLDRGKNWRRFSRGLRLDEEVADLVLNRDNANPPTLYAATQRRGFWRRALVSGPER